MFFILGFLTRSLIARPVCALDQTFVETTRKNFNQQSQTGINVHPEK
jgi:hypothetical protein